MVECMPFCIDRVGGGVTWWNACRFVLTGVGGSVTWWNAYCFVLMGCEVV